MYTDYGRGYQNLVKNKGDETMQSQFEVPFKDEPWVLNLEKLIIIYGQTVPTNLSSLQSTNQVSSHSMDYSHVEENIGDTNKKGIEKTSRKMGKWKAEEAEKLERAVAEKGENWEDISVTYFNVKYTPRQCHIKYESIKAGETSSKWELNSNKEPWIQQFTNIPLEKFLPQ
jgi:Myb-like DNA-binding domain